MTSARAEWTGVGAALLFHVALIAGLSLSLAKLKNDPEPPSMQVDIVDEVALESMSPQQVAQPASAPPPAAESIPEPSPPQPIVPPPPTPRIVPQPAIKPAPPTPRQPPKATPRQPTKAAPPPQKKAPPRPSPRAGLGDDFLSKLDDDLAPRGQAKAAAPTFSAKARASVASSIASQAQRCANRQPYLGEGADEVVMSLTLNFSRSGRLTRPPQITGASGPADARSKYGDLLEDQIRRIFTECAPFRLPADLYDTDNGGWKTTTLKYKVKK